MEYFTGPGHVTQWNNASPDWYCRKATNDLQPGGTFSYTMAARDGSFSFDFGGGVLYRRKNKKISYTIGDGRKVDVPV